MLYVTGQFKGKSMDMEPVSWKELLKAAGVPEFKKNLRLKLPEALKKNDPLNRRVKHAQARIIPTKCSVVIDGEEVEITYSSRRPIENKKTGIIRTWPKKLTYSGNLMLIDTKSDPEVATFFLLNPRNGDSPVRKKNERNVWWLVDDVEKQAQEDNNRVNNVIELLQEIQKENSFNKLKRIALGFRMAVSKNGRKGMVVIKGAKDMEDINELRTALSKMAMDYPNEFSDHYRSASVLLRGTAQQAIDAGLIRLDGLGAGISVWRWTIDGQDIVNVPAGTDSKSALVGHLHNANILTAFIDKMNDNLARPKAEELSSILTAGATGEEPPSEPTKKTTKKTK